MAAPKTQWKEVQETILEIRFKQKHKDEARILSGKNKRHQAGIREGSHACFLTSKFLFGL